MVKLIMDAGKKSIESCHHETAYIYLEAASSLLPHDCWKNYYDISIRLNFLTANAANASCKYDKAEIILKKILSEGRCVEDKVPSYYLLIQSKLFSSVLISDLYLCLPSQLNGFCHFPVLQGQGKVVDAYNTCSSILTQLGETISESVLLEACVEIIAETLTMHYHMFGDAWIEKEMEDKTLQNIVKFYGAMATCAYFFQEEHMVGYIICKMAQLSLRHGPCQYTPIAFLKLSYIINPDGSNAALAQ